MSRPTRALSFVVLSVLLLSGCGQQSNSAGSSPRYQPVFHATSCPFKVGTGALSASQIRCGYLAVPESRQVANSPTIKLAVAVFKSPYSNPAPDPLVYLVGGPGTPVVAQMGAVIAVSGIPAFVGNRDFILVDQRGAGLSQPSLACRPSDTEKSCRAWLVNQGIHLAAYNTVENAADIADVRVALGYKEINVLGESYGSTLALQLMRDHPQGIRSVMMNAVTGPTFNMFNDYIPNTWHGLQQIFKDCAASSGCNTQYPHLEQKFTALLARLEAHPAHLRVYDNTKHRYVSGTVDAVTLWWAANEWFAVPSHLSTAPQMISQIAAGDFSSVLQASRAQQLTPQANITWGMNESMECSGEQATSSPAKIAAGARGVPTAIRQALIASEVAGLNTCAAWHVPSIPAMNHTYFRSAIPTLLMAGSYDPKTSPAQIYPLAKHLGHAYTVLFPTMSHDITWSECPGNVMSDFLTHPSRKPDTSCTQFMSMVWE